MERCSQLKDDEKDSFNKAFAEKYEENILELTETHPLFGHTLELINWFKRDLFTIHTQLTLNLPTGHGLTLYWDHQWEDYNDRTYQVFRDLLAGEFASVTKDNTIKFLFVVTLAFYPADQPLNTYTFWSI